MRIFLLVLSLAVPVWAQTDYQRDVHPVLAAKCFACHGGDKRSGGLSLRDYAGILEGGRSGAVVVPGISAESLIMRRTTGEIQPAMPPGGPALTASELSILRSWIDQGARETPRGAVAKRRWTPPLELKEPALPGDAPSGWEAPLDRLLAAYFKRVKTPTPSAVVNDSVFARRAYLDIWGLLPSPEQLREFAADRAVDKRPRLVRQLLAHRKNYAGHWLTFWNDLLRNEDTFGIYGGDRKSISDWLVKSLESNLPYDKMVAALLNPAAADDPEGFLVGVNWRGDSSAAQMPWMQAAQNSAQVFLGINLKCNSCHDSFTSRWKLKDAYALASFFSPDAKLEMVRCDNRLGEFATPGFLYPELNKPAGETLAERHAAAAAMFTDPRNGRTPRTFVNRIWARLMGRGIVDPVDDMDAEPWDPALLDYLSAEFVKRGWDIHWLLETIIGSKAYQLPSVSARSDKAYTFAGPQVRRLTAEQFIDSLSAITGEWPILQPPSAREARYVREAHMTASPLSLALGRPIRDQVVTERSSDATTLQMLELVNGPVLYDLLHRGAQRMLDSLPPAPKYIYASSVINGNEKEPRTAEIEVKGVDELWLLVRDFGSYYPERTLPVWASPVFIAEDGREVPALSLKPKMVSGIRNETTEVEFKTGVHPSGLRATAGATVVYDIRGRNFTRFRATLGIEAKATTSDINSRLRFFAFTEKPNEERLIPIDPQRPVAAPEGPFTTEQLARRIFLHAFGREHSKSEARLAHDVLDLRGKPSVEGLTDLLWSVAMTPEFQLIL